MLAVATISFNAASVMKPVIYWDCSIRKVCFAFEINKRVLSEPVKMRTITCDEDFQRKEPRHVDGTTLLRRRSDCSCCAGV